MQKSTYEHRIAFELGSAIGYLSRADQGIGVFWHAAPPTRLCLEFPRETGKSVVPCPVLTVAS